MFATIRRYDGVDQNRSVELTHKVNETLVPKLEKLSGFKGYYLIDAGNGVFTSLGLFETPEQGMESTKLVTTWIRDEKLETILPNDLSGRHVHALCWEGRGEGETAPTALEDSPDAGAVHEPSLQAYRWLTEDERKGIRLHPLTAAILATRKNR